jgi:hypothetical protein
MGKKRERRKMRVEGEGEAPQQLRNNYEFWSEERRER